MRITSVPQCAQGKKILVVEDEEVVRKVCAALLRHHAFEYIFATNGAEGVEIYRDRHREICLVLSDVSMPVKDGLDMSREILAMHAHAKVILMSGYDACDLVPEDLRKLCPVLKKPFTSLTLIETVKQCLENEKEHAQSAYSD